MSLTLRTLKGSRLTHAELDNNFIFLEGRDIVDMNIIAGNLVLTKDSGGALSVSLSGFTGGSISGDTYVTSGVLSGSTLNLTRNDGGIVSVDLSALAGSGATTLTQLLDTDITSPSSGDTLTYHGGNWINLSEVNLYFTASSNGQTYFTNQLPTQPKFPTRTEFWVNGQKQRYGTSNDFVLSGATNRDFVWFNKNFTLFTTDELNVKYK